MILVFKRTNVTAVAPTRAHEDDAGLDIYGDCPVVIDPGEIVCITTGVCIALPYRAAGQFVGKSGRAWKGGLPVGMVILAGLIDSGYRGELKIIASNLGREPINIPLGSAACQMVINSERGLIYPTPIELTVEEFAALPATIRDERGFGSTDKVNARAAGGESKYA